MDKVSCIVTDSGANIIAAVAKCMQKKQLPCFAHLLNLVVQDFIKNSDELEEVMDKVKKTHIILSPQCESYRQIGSGSRPAWCNTKKTGYGCGNEMELDVLHAQECFGTT